MESLISQIELLSQIGISLSQDKGANELLDEILQGAIELTSADGGTFYSVEDGGLVFKVIKNQTLGIDQICDEPGKFKPIPLYYENGSHNHSAVVAHAYHEQKTINIADIYNDERYDFSGAKNFDSQAGYSTHSLLTVPMKNHEDDVIAVLQLINAKDAQGKVTSFDDSAQKLAESLASQAAISLTNRNLIQAFKDLFNALIRMLAESIDEKSPYTGGHCRRVPVITMMLAEAADRYQQGELADFSMTPKDFHELETAAWLHDCGKVTTPEYVVDKSTKLETIFDRIELVRLRLELAAKDRIIQAYREGCQNPEQDGQLAEELDKLRDDLRFLRKVNLGGEFLPDADVERIKALAARTAVPGELENDPVPVLSQDEASNLMIRKGTLNERERLIIQNHAVVSIRMLEALPFPKELARVPEYAGAHHEKLDGSGYPRGLKAHQMSIPARIMAIADIFEALSASDRPYKSGKRMSECLRILAFMAKDQHIDPGLFRVFLEERVYQHYGEQFLKPEQLDEVDVPGLLKLAGVE